MAFNEIRAPQPWHFVAVADPEVKRRIREGAERKEHELYARRAPQEWLDVLAPMGVDENKPFLETASYLIAIFAQSYALLPDGCNKAQVCKNSVTSDTLQQ